MINPDKVPVPDFLTGVFEELALIYGLKIDDLYALKGFRTGHQLTVLDTDIAVRWLSESSGKPWAPLYIATLFNLRQMRIGPLLASCGTIKEALRLFHRYHTLIHPYVDVQFEKIDNRLALKMPIHADTRTPAWCAELLFGGIPYWAKRFTGEEMVLHEVWFRHPSPPYVEHYHSLFKCDVCFEQAYDCLWTDPCFLDVKIQTHSPAFHSTALTTLESDLKNNLTLSQRIKDLIRSKLPEESSIADIAHCVLCSERTLQRKLAEEGTCVKKLRQLARCEEALSLLSETKLSVEQIADKLGYEHRSSFVSTFKQLTGKTPQEWRAMPRHYPELATRSEFHKYT